MTSPRRSLKFSLQFEEYEMKKNLVVGLILIVLTSFALISFQIGRTPFMSLATLPVSGWCVEQHLREPI